MVRNNPFGELGSWVRNLNARQVARPTSGTRTPAPVVPGQAAADQMTGLAGGLLPVSAAQQASMQITPPKVAVPDFSGLPSITSFVPQIRESGQLKLQSGLSALRSQYGQQNEELSSQLAASGTYDAGDKYKLENQMFSNRGQEETQLISNIQAETLTQEVAEMQRQGTISEERARMIIDYNFKSAIQNGDWQQAAAIHNADIGMQIQTHNANIVGLKADLIAKGNDALVKWADIEIQKLQVGIQQGGLDVQRDRLLIDQQNADTAQYHEDILMCGSYDDGVNECLQEARERLDARMGEYGPSQPQGGNSGGGQGTSGYSMQNSPVGTTISGSQLQGWYNSDPGRAPTVQNGQATSINIGGTIWSIQRGPGGNPVSMTRIG